MAVIQFQPRPMRRNIQQGIDTYLANLPALLAAEQGARTTYDPQRIQDQQALQATYGPSQYGQQLDALHQLDPASAVIRDQLAGNVSSDLSSGRNLPPELQNVLNSQIRGAQVARGGSAIGNAPVSAEAAYGAQAAENLYQQHILTPASSSDCRRQNSRFWPCNPSHQIGQVLTLIRMQASKASNSRSITIRICSPEPRLVEGAIPGHLR